MYRSTLLMVEISSEIVPGEFPLCGGYRTSKVPVNGVNELNIILMGMEGPCIHC